MESKNMRLTVDGSLIVNGKLNAFQSRAFFIVPISKDTYFEIDNQNKGYLRSSTVEMFYISDKNKRVVVNLDNVPITQDGFLYVHFTEEVDNFTFEVKSVIASN